MRDKIAGHSFAILMKSAFKHLATVFLLFILSSSSIYASILTPKFLDASSKFAVEHSAFSELSRDCYTFYTQNPLTKSYVVTDSFLFEIEEEEQDVRQLGGTRNIPCFKSFDSNFNQDFIKTTSSIKQKSCNFYFSFFKSKTATSLYLLFEVFRI